MRTVLVLLPVLLVVSTNGCWFEKSCTSAGCMDHLTVTFDTAVTTAGTYTIEVVADGESMTCEVTVPPSPTADTCSNPSLSPIWRGKGTQSTEPSATQFAGFGLIGRYQNVEFEVRGESDTLYSSSGTPEYRGVEVNGEGCGECFIAEWVASR